MDSRQSQYMIASLPDILEQTKSLSHDEPEEAPVA